jgi:hypothetical protein
MAKSTSVPSHIFFMVAPLFGIGSSRFLVILIGKDGMVKI